MTQSRSHRSDANLLEPRASVCYLSCFRKDFRCFDRWREILADVDPELHASWVVRQEGWKEAGWSDR